MNIQLFVGEKTNAAELNRIFKATNKNDPKPTDLEALRTLLNEDPAIWQRAADLAVSVQNSILEESFGKSAFLCELMKKQLRELRDQLGWKQATKLEQIAIRHVCLCWFNLNITEQLVNKKLSDSHSTETGLYWDKRLTGAQKRHLRAVETLAKVRKLATETRLIETRAEDAKQKRALRSAHLINQLSSES